MTLKVTLEKVKAKNFEIEIFGMGYVGFPLAVRLSSSGFRVLGIDTDSNRIQRILKNSLRESELNLKDEFLHARQLGNLDFASAPQTSKNPKVGMI